MSLTGQDDVKVGFGASLTGLRSGFEEATRIVTKGAQGMQTGLDAVSNAAGLAGRAIAAMGAVLAGGAFISSAISETVAYATSVKELGKRMQLSAADASTMATAIDDSFLSIEQVTAATSAMNRQLRSNEESFKAVGIQTRDASGQLLSQKDLLSNTLTKLRGYKEGTDQLLAAQQLLGRGIQADVLDKLFDMQDGMEDAEKAAKELGLQLSEENLQATQAYKVANDNMGDSLLGIKNAIGNALMPVVTQLMSILANAGAAIIPVVSFAFRTLGTVLLGIIDILYTLWQVFKAVIQTITTGLAGYFDVLTKLVSGDFSGAKAAWNALGDTVADAWAQAGDNIIAKNAEVTASMKAMWGAGAGESPGSGPSRTGSGTYTPPAAKNDGASKESKELLDKFRAELELMRQAQGDYAELSKQAEAEFWQSKIDFFDRGSKEYLTANGLFLRARRDAAREGIEREKEDLAAQADSAGNDYQERIRLADAWVARMGETYGRDSKQYREALQRKLEAERSYHDQQRQFAEQRQAVEQAGQLKQIELAQQMLQLQVQMGILSKDEQLRLERELITQRYEMQLQALKDKELLYQGDLETLERINQEKRLLEQQLQFDLATNQLNTVRSTFDTWSGMTQSLFQTVGNVAQGLITQTMTWRQALQSIASSVLSSFIQMGVERLKNWVLTEVMMTSATTAANTARTGAQVAGSATVMTTKAVEAGAVVTANAAEAATGAAASQAPIPIIGPALAIAAAGAMLAFVLGMGGGGGKSLPSAAGGWWDVSGDTLAMIHKKEMVMPAPLAEGVRNAVEAGTLGSGTTFQGPLATISALDGADVERVLVRHGDKFAEALADKVRAKMSSNRGF